MRVSKAVQAVLDAMLHGKLTRPEEGMEDLLTSNTFGLFKYLPVDEALLPFLQCAQNPLTGKTLSEMLPGKLSVTGWRFWPAVEYRDCAWCEPDVEIILSDNRKRTFGLFIEAKYRSGKSSFANDELDHPSDQLARELDNLRGMAKEQGLEDYAVVYLTADYTCPAEDIMASADEYEKKRKQKAKIYWQSWRNLPDVLLRVTTPFCGMAEDLRQLFFRMGLTSFTRLRIENLCPPKWTFLSAPQPTPPVAPPSPWEWIVVAPRWAFGSQTVQKGRTEQNQSFSFDQPFRRPDLLFSWRSQK